MSNLLIASYYFGPAELYRAIAKSDTVIVDLGEHYVKQSYRTRSRIIGANGIEELSVHINRTHRKTPMREMLLSHKENWRAEHWHAIRSAYGQSAWFIHYADDLRNMILHPHTNLVERNLASMRMMMSLAEIDKDLNISESFVEDDTAIDLRSSLHPKKPLPDMITELKPYRQVFEARHGFVRGLSMIDLLMNMGPETAIIMNH